MAVHLSEEQKGLILQVLQTNIRKTQWVLDNKKDLDEENKKRLEVKIQKMKEIVELLKA